MPEFGDSPGEEIIRAILDGRLRRPQNDDGLGKLVVVGGDRKNHFARSITVQVPHIGAAYHIDLPSPDPSGKLMVSVI